MTANSSPPPQARQHLIGVQYARHGARHGQEQLVAGRMPERVVHLLEAVEIEEEEGDAARAGFGQRQLLLQASREARPVR